MNILIIGSGGREHAIADSFNRSSKVEKVFVSPGNPGMKNIAKLVSLHGLDEMEAFVKNNNIKIVFIGPEQPLANGLKDELTARGITAIGPTKSATRLESSKTFSKKMMKKYGIPTAEYASFSNFEEAKKYISESKHPLVLKADGLAAGKGVIISNNKEESYRALTEIMKDKKFGESGNKIVIEEFLVGWEASIFAFCDGENFISTVFSQDHKSLLDGDKGVNTGGMGAFAPVLEAQKFKEDVDENVFKKILDGMKKENSPFSGVLFAGLMINGNDFKVLEFNCRFGDPETEVILPLLKTDFVDICEAIKNKKINKINLEWKDKFAVTVVAASGGYPEKYEKNLPIFIQDGLVLNDENRLYFAGVKEEKNKLFTAGGRVLMLTAVGDTLNETIEQVYENLDNIHFEKLFYRKDIGKRDLSEY